MDGRKSDRRQLRRSTRRCGRWCAEVTNDLGTRQRIGRQADQSVLSENDANAEDETRLAGLEEDLNNYNEKEARRAILNG